MTNLILDLDGTLLDPRLRLYQLFRELVPEAPWSFDQYWRMKRDCIGQREMLIDHLRYTAAQAEQFRSAWLEKVEEPQRLALDRPFAGVSDFLARAARRAALFLVTARQHPERAVAQVDKLGWRRYFSEILVTGQKLSKAALIRSRLTTSANDIWVGDSGDDVVGGKELGVRTVAVTSGGLGETALREYLPDQILASVVDLVLQ
jgi:phosphoglycolate phosphatase